MALANGLTPKQDEFARAYVETGCAAAAYRKAYNAENTKQNVIHVKASELLANGKVAVRVQQLIERAQKRHDMTIDDITEMLKDDREFARKVGQAGASVTAAMGIAKLHGLITDKAEIGGKADAPSINVTITRTVKQV